MATVLDWRDARHYDRTRTLPCRWCGLRTPPRDEHRTPAHQVCAESTTNDNGGPLSAKNRGRRQSSTVKELETSSMTQPTHLRGEHLCAAVSLAASGVPVLPLRAGKVPFGNCPRCTGNVCGGRPNMKTPGPCVCPAPCHGWAAATTNPDVLNGPAWAPAWRQAAAVAYHPGGAGLTVVDLDNADAITWARANLPATRTVRTTRGEHWLYRGVMPSANAVRPGVDIKSAMAYARWLGPGTGNLTTLPEAVHALAVKEPAPVRPAGVIVRAPAEGGKCPHRTPTFLDRGIAMAEQRITEAAGAVHATVFGTFLAVLSTHGRCGCLTPAHTARLFTAAQAKGETARHCTDAWTNALNRLGL